MRWTILVLWALLSATSAMGQVSVGIGAPRRQHRHQRADVPGAGPGAGLSGLLRSGWTRTTSSTTACTGSTRATTGTRAPGTTARGAGEPGGRAALRAARSRPLLPAAPAYFRGWRPDAPPRWGEHWGNDWDAASRGWDSGTACSVPAPAPLPVYQRQYSGNRYPRGGAAAGAARRNYRYQPHEAVASSTIRIRRTTHRLHLLGRGAQQAPVARSPGQHDPHPSAPPHGGASGRARAGAAAAPRGGRTRAADATFGPGQRCARQGSTARARARARTRSGSRAGRRTRSGAQEVGRRCGVSARAARGTGLRA